MNLWILLIVLGFVAVHMFKMARLYLVLMEHKISFGRFVFLYLRTTFVNLIIPFKLGEIYRVEEITRETKVWQVGLLSVLVDRYYDVLALVLLLFPFDLFVRGNLSPITILLLGVMIIVAVLYFSVPASYTYLNRYLIMRKSSKRSMAALRSLDIVKNWYDFTKNLITGRAALIVLASLLGWMCEVLTLKALACYKGIAFGLGDFAFYIEAIFMNKESVILSMYTNTTALVFLLLTLTGILVSVCNKIRKGKA